MAASELESFIARCRAVMTAETEPAVIVERIAPLMRGLLLGPTSFLAPEHFRSDPAHYARNAIHMSQDGELSLFALVWLPGQWTPVHDHGKGAWSVSCAA
jgi:predicted metal-dependent enzyme (double-stranded beta helix superfamily)